MDSQKFSLNTIDWKKIGTHFFLVAVSAGITYLISVVDANAVNAGNAAIYVTIVSTVLKGVQRFLSSYN